MRKGSFPGLMHVHSSCWWKPTPNIAADAKAIAFGNFKRGYTIVDRIGTRILRDPYTNKPFVGFYTTKRTGGMLVDSQAIKLMKIGAATRQKAAA